MASMKDSFTGFYAGSVFYIGRRLNRFDRASEREPWRGP